MSAKIIDSFCSGRQAKLHMLFGIDLRSLAALRIVMAILLLYDLIARSRFITVNYTDSGVLPASLLSSWDRLLSLRAISSSFLFQNILLVLAGCFALMLLVGWQTRLATIASWFLLCSLHARNSFLNNGGDDLFRAILLWSMFLPLGQRWAIDAFRSQKRLRQGASVLSMATIAILLQLSFLYISTGLEKSGPKWHVDGTAIQLALGQSAVVRPFGEWLRQYPGCLKLLTPTAVYFEILAPLLIFVPFYAGKFRMLVIVCFWLFQIGLGLCLNTVLFPWVATAATIPFIPAFFWNLSTLESKDSAESDASDGANAPPGQARAGTVADRSRWPQILVVLLLCFLATSALRTLFSTRRGTLQKVGHSLGLVDVWSMYGNPQDYDMHFDVVATLHDGTTLSFFEIDNDPQWRLIDRIHESMRFNNYLRAATPKREVSKHYILWLMRSWNGPRSTQQRIAGLGRYFVSTGILAPDGPHRVLIEEVRTKDGVLKYFRRWSKGGTRAVGGSHKR